MVFWVPSEVASQRTAAPAPGVAVVAHLRARLPCAAIVLSNARMAAASREMASNRLFPAPPALAPVTVTPLVPPSRLLSSVFWTVLAPPGAPVPPQPPALV